MRTERAVPPSTSALTPPSSHAELSELLRALQAVRDGDFSVRLPGDWTGLEGKIADIFNEIVASNARMASELEAASGKLADLDDLLVVDRRAGDRRGVQVPQPELDAEHLRDRRVGAGQVAQPLGVGEQVGAVVLVAG